MNEELNKELEELAPSLSKLTKEHFDAPEGYFNTFSGRLLDRIKNEQEAPQTPTIISIVPWKKYLMAASVFIFMGTSMYVFKLNHTQVSVSNNADSQSMVDVYLSEIDEATLIEFSNTNNTKDEKSDIDVYQSYIDEQSIIDEL